MKKYIILLFSLVFYACSIDNGISTENDEISNNFWQDCETSEKIMCLERINKNNVPYETFNYEAYQPDSKYGIHIANGLYLSNWYRSAFIDGVTVHFEFYSDNYIIEGKPISYLITYRFSPVDTFFTELWTDELKIYNNRLTSFTAREYTHDKFKLEILSLEVKYNKVYMDSIEYKHLNYTDYSCETDMFNTSTIKIWEGSIILEGNADYIRRKCEKGHACDGYTGGGAGGTLCNDGWVSGSTGSGTCSWHGGIAK